MLYFIATTSLVFNAIMLLFLSGIYWRKRVWKRRAKIANWSENVLLYNVNKAGEYADRLNAWNKRHKQLRSDDVLDLSEFDDPN